MRRRGPRSCGFHGGRRLTRHCRLPSNVSLDLGALAEPLSVAMHARDRAKLPEGATVLVFGAGAVGLLCAAVCKAAQAKAVVIADIQKDRVDFAVANGYADAGFVVPMARPEGIDEKLYYAEQVADMAKETEVRGEAVGEVSAVFECTGVESCMQSAIYVREAADGDGGGPRFFWRYPVTDLLAGEQTRWKSHDHRHGCPYPHAAPACCSPT